MKHKVYSNENNTKKSVEFLKLIEDSRNSDNTTWSMLDNFIYMYIYIYMYVCYVCMCKKVNFVSEQFMNKHRV